MLVFYFVGVVLVCGASAAPSRQKRFDVYDPDFPFSYVFDYPRAFGGYAGPTGAYAGPSGAYAGSSAGFGQSGFYPFQNPYRVPFFIPMPMPMPVPDFSQVDFNPWYKGENVCIEKKIINDDAEVSEWLSEGFDGNFNYNQETCRGNSVTYVCVKRVQSNEGAKREVTKYKCCHGFVRSFDGRSGCVEATDDEGSPSDVTAVPSVKSFRLSDQFKYSLVKGDSKSKSGVENVPAQ